MKTCISFNKTTMFLVASAVLFACEHPSTSALEPAFFMDARALVSEFLADEAGSSAKYIDQIIQVSGPVYQLDKTDGQITGIKLSNDEFAIVNCSFQEMSDQILEPGIVTVKGVCSGFMGDKESMLPGGTVELTRCVIVNPN